MTALQFDLPFVVLAAMAATTAIGGAISGHRLHRWLYHHFDFARRWPGDAGAWAGLAVGVVSAYLLLRG